MLNVKYYKDLSHNFLIINSKMGEKEQNYQYRMISRNKIKHLLDCKIRYVDEECSFYYEISSKQNLKNLFDKKGMGYGQIFHLLESIKEVLDELDNFLLDGKYLLLMPEYIFAEPEAKEYYFLYYPCAQEMEGQGALMPLAEFLVDKVDHGQEDAVEMAYKIYESVQDDNFVLPQILSLFRSPSPEMEEENTVDTVWAEDVEEADADVWDAEDDLDSGQDGGEEDKEESGSHLPVMGSLAFLCAAAAAGIFSIGYFFTLSVEEKLISTVGMIILVILSAFLFLYFIINLFKRRKGTKIQKEKGETGKQRVEYVKTEIPYSRKTKESVKRSAEVHGMGGKSAVYPEEYGNTVFLDASAYKKENKLYGTNKGNKYHIDLDKLPCTIGKMAGNVDIVIKDSTISRIHARFTKQENGIYVTDMNSTNGTFKNGLRLDPNETVLIELGDELRFGRLTFCYR